MFATYTKKLPDSIKNVRFYMTLLPLRDPQVSKSWAEGFIRAGLKGKSGDIFTISKENKLTSDELRKLFFGRKVNGFNMMTGQQWWIERSDNGKATIRDGDKFDTGKSWVEQDMLCDRWENLYESLDDCWVVYRNPAGTLENSDEYLGAPGYGIYPFSIAE
jgi:hypothetical protein